MVMDGVDGWIHGDGEQVGWWSPEAREGRRDKSIDLNKLVADFLGCTTQDPCGVESQKSYGEQFVCVRAAGGPEAREGRRVRS